MPMKLEKSNLKIMDLKSPKELEILGNVSENWKRIKQRFEIYLEASGLNEKKDKTKTAIFFNIAGENATYIYSNFIFEKEEDKYNLDIILKKLKTIAIH
ncbi:AREL1 [Cordylochernes scorpioides]|uniref:AREL1 n=1 Tax=Cordylochernes scorpioides TaxID=51811 RepID=A0ABY6KAR6_9ARAC|nr:AREL1 [Cordylochernes scorpioides]